MASHITLLFFLVLFTLASAISLQFNKKGEFTILQITDLHFCEDDTKDANTQKLERKLIQKSKPDLVVISGDAISGHWSAAQPGRFEKCLSEALEPIVEAKIPYVYILGNHDAQGLLNRKQIIQLDQENPFSVRKGCEGIPDTSNFILPIFSGKDHDKIAVNIWLFDSGNKGCDGFADTWGCVEPEVLDWYDDQSKQFKKEHGTDVHHIAFVHIPVPEFTHLINNEEIYGTMIGEIPCCPYVNTGLFEHIKNNGDISAMFVGHDHTNNIGGYLDGIELVYGQKTGYGAYGNERGGKVIKFKEDKDGKVIRSHYIIHENGELIRPENPKKWRNASFSCPYFGYEPLGSFKRMLWNFKGWLKN